MYTLDKSSDSNSCVCAYSWACVTRECPSTGQRRIIVMAMLSGVVRDLNELTYLYWMRTDASNNNAASASTKTTSRSRGRDNVNSNKEPIHTITGAQCLAHPMLMANTCECGT